MKLQMVNVTRKFGDFRAVENLNLTIENGVYGLLGVNGAGKTTLMRMICTLLPPTSGQILCDGKDIFKMDGEYRNLLGYLPQEFGFYPDFTVKDYLLYIASLKGIRPMVAGKRVKDLLAQVGLTKSANKKMKKLSGGMKRRAGIAQAMLNNPKILILDEPTAGLDPTERVRFRNLISELSEDRIVILSTHIVSDVEYIANEIWLMKDGQIMQQGNLDQTLASMSVKGIYMEEDKKEEIKIVKVTEELIKAKTYEVRGYKVMLDFDLAKIYGYLTKAFNQQVKNNSERFASDFAFKLTKEEVNNLRSKNLTSSWGGSRYLPNAFTEQGIYMLMTILKGDLAVKQSIDLVRTFKKMKDYILENRELIGQRELLQLSMETANNRIEISKINSDMISIEKQISDVVEGLKDVVTKSELADMMNSFISDDDEKWLMYNAKFSSADEVYASIYRQAKVSIYVVDNYIGCKRQNLRLG